MLEPFSQEVETTPALGGFMRFMRAKPFLACFAGGVLLAVLNIVQGKSGTTPGELIGGVIGMGLGASIWAIPYCFFTRKKHMATLEAKQSD